MAWLRRIPGGASLAELYEGAFVMVETASPPGFVRFVSHAIREICNRLPDRILGDSSEHLRHSKRLEEIDKAWPDRKRVSLSSLPANPSPNPGGGVLVPHVVAHQLSVLIDDDHAVDGKNVRRAMKMFEEAEKVRTGRTIQDAARAMMEPAVRQWLTLVRWGVANAHDSGKQDGDADLTELRSRFALLEEMLANLHRDYYSARGELDDVLAKANT